MAIKIVNINEPAPNGEEVNNTLNSAIETAKEGNISNCFIVMVTNDNYIITSWANGSMHFTMAGAIEATKQEFINATVEKRK